MPNTQPAEVIRLNSSGKLTYYKSPTGRLSLPRGCTGVADDALKNNLDIKYFDTYYNGTDIGRFAFAFASNLQRAILRTGVTTIGTGAFQQCSKLQYMIMPSTINSLGDQVFHYCSELKHADLSETQLTVLPTYTFSFCEQLKAVDLPDKMDEIGRNAFQYCGALKTIKLPNALRVIDSEAFKNSGLVELTIPKATGVIGICSFFECKDLTRLNFEADSVLEAIGTEAFAKTNLIDIHIPASVQVIEKNAFANCKNLVSVSFGSDAQMSMLANTVEIFNGCEKLAKIDFPRHAFHRVPGTNQ